MTGKAKSQELFFTHERVARLELTSFGFLWCVLAWHPVSRVDWLLENALVLAALPIFLAGYRHRLFSSLSHTLVFLFMCLHQIGAHYTYSLVPYDDWWRWLTGSSFNSMLGWERNHFDRLVHFLYGLLMAYPIREIFLRIANVRGFWGYFLPLDFTMSTSLLYELIEWVAAVVLGGEAGQAYLGTQGDVWDAHKDMALASLGATLAMLLTAAINRRYQRDFAREWSESWRVKSGNQDFM